MGDRGALELPELVTVAESPNNWAGAEHYLNLIGGFLTLKGSPWNDLPESHPEQGIRGYVIEYDVRPAGEGTTIRQDLALGNARLGSITGCKFEDLNGNGRRDPGEPGLNGWTIELVDAVTGQVVDSQVTQSVDLNEDAAIDPGTEQGTLPVRSGIAGRVPGSRSSAGGLGAEFPGHERCRRSAGFDSPADGLVDGRWRRKGPDCRTGRRASG